MRPTSHRGRYHERVVGMSGVVMRRERGMEQTEAGNSAITPEFRGVPSIVPCAAIFDNISVHAASKCPGSVGQLRKPVCTQHARTMILNDVQQFPRGAQRRTPPPKTDVQSPTDAFAKIAVLVFPECRLDGNGG